MLLTVVSLPEDHQACPPHAWWSLFNLERNSLEVDMSKQATWKPHTSHGELDSKDQKALPDEVFAFPKQRKEPLIDAAHVRTALARFDQVKEVSDEDRELAFINILKAGKYYEVEIKEKDWRQLGKQPHTENSA
jgi:hypothetical protein